MRKVVKLISIYLTFYFAHAAFEIYGAAEYEEVQSVRVFFGDTVEIQDLKNYFRDSRITSNPVTVLADSMIITDTAANLQNIRKALSRKFGTTTEIRWEKIIPENAEKRNRAQDLLSEDQHARLGAANDLLAAKLTARERLHIVATLLSIVANNKDDGRDSQNESTSLAINLLGELSAREAIPYLVKALLYGPESSSIGATGVNIDVYPSALALVKIGTPAIEPLFISIEKSGDSKERQVAATLIMEIYSNDGLTPEESLHRFDSRIEGAQGIKRNRLQNARGFIGH